MPKDIVIIIRRFGERPDAL
jgi:hypothetical protein